MSDFEKEYKKYSEESVPDLWDRIEAGVDAYEAQAAESAPADNVAYNNVVPISNETKKRIPGVYVGLIAAAACVLIAVPAMIFTNKAGSSSEIPTGYMAEAEAPMADSVMEAAAEAPAMAEDAAAAEEPVMVEEAEAAEEPMTDTEAYEESAEENTKESPAQIVKQPAGAAASSEESAMKAPYPVRAAWEFKDESMVRFSFDEPVSDFKLLDIEVTDVTEDGDLVYNSKVAFDGGSFVAGDNLVIEVIFMGDIPNNAISFKDSNGNEWVLFVSLSGKDGSVILSER